MRRRCIGGEVALMMLLVTPGAQAQSYRIGVHTYVPAMPAETVGATFTLPDGGVTSSSYYGFVRLVVSGSGVSCTPATNDAFYIHQWQPGCGNPNVVPQHDPNWYQLTFNTQTLVASAPSRDAARFIYYDVDAGVEVLSRPYVPAYRTDHTYSFIIDTGLFPASAAPLHFGVSDGGFGDNSGAYQIQVTQLQQGRLSRKPAVGDFDGDGRSDITIYRPNSGEWFVLPSGTDFNPARAWATYQWGSSTDIPLRADFDGDGRSDVVVYRPSDGGWYIRYSSVGYATNQWAYFQWGLASDIPIPADFDGDGKSDLALYRPADGGWYIRYSSVGYALNQWGFFQWGTGADKPLAADFDGDGKSDLALYRPADGGWYIRYSSVGYAVDQWAYFQWGSASDTPLVTDFDGDGRTDLVIYRPSGGGWYIRYSSAGYSLNRWAYLQWGMPTDTPVPSDLDGDGETDLAIFRPSDGGWYVRYSSAGYALNQWAYYQWGLSTDIPLKQ